MAVDTKNDRNKWIQTSVALACMFLAYLSLTFLETLAEWFDLEASIPNYQWLAQGFSIVLGLVCFLVIVNKDKTAVFLKEVYAEAIKVVWPDRSETFRMTIGIMIGVSIAGLIFWVFDFVANILLNLIR